MFVRPRSPTKALRSAAMILVTLTVPWLALPPAGAQQKSRFDLQVGMSAAQFVKVCAAQGLHAKSSNGQSCADFIALGVGVIVYDAKPSRECESLVEKIDSEEFLKPSPPTHPVIQAVFDWLRGRPDFVGANNLADAIRVATDSLYGCH